MGGQRRRKQNYTAPLDTQTWKIPIQRAQPGRCRAKNIMRNTREHSLNRCFVRWSLHIYVSHEQTVTVEAFAAPSPERVVFKGLSFSSIDSSDHVVDALYGKPKKLKNARTVPAVGVQVKTLTSVSDGFLGTLQKPAKKKKLRALLAKSAGNWMGRPIAIRSF